MKDTSGYQNTFTSLPNHQSKSNSDMSKPQRDDSFESWLNDEPSAKPSSGNSNRAPAASSSTSSSSSKKSSSAQSSKPKAPAKAAPAPNLINFDDDNKWADDDDAGWESIDTK